MIREVSPVYALADSGFVIICCPMPTSQLAPILLKLLLMLQRISNYPSEGVSTDALRICISP